MHNLQSMKRVPLLSRRSEFAHHFSFLLNRCMRPKALRPCKQLHALMLTNNVDMDDWSLSSRLIAAYACCRDLASSNLLFQETPNPNVFALNWMVLALVQSGFHGEAVRWFSTFRGSSCYGSPNRYTFSVIQKACVGLMDVALGRQFHCLSCKLGFEQDLSVCNGLVDMYGKCRKVCDARAVFDEMPERDVATWTMMICGYADSGEIRDSLVLFERMRLENVEPNEYTWNAMIVEHARLGDCDGAFDLLTRMGEAGLVPDLVTWNAMISGFVRSHRAAEALELFQDMLVSGIRPNEVTVTALLQVFGMLGSISWGREIHGLIYRMGIVLNDFVASALIHMYSKCGSVGGAWTIFSCIPSRNAALWNAMIGCYGKHGMVESAVELFERMQEEEIQPNEFTLISVLYACSHGGQVEKGLEFFRSMDEYGVKPNKEHYSCLVDLLCRYGRMEEAYDIVKHMGVEAMDSTVGAFLNGCKIHERRDLAEKISGRLEKPGDFVTLANIYASEGEWGGVLDTREVMKGKKVHKKPGFSSGYSAP